MTNHPHRNQAVLYAGSERAKAAAAVVLIHGRGGSAEDILGLGQEIAVPDLALVAPKAAGNTWYPYSFLASLEQNEPFLSSALEILRAVVQSCVDSGIPRDRIVLLGFSQGACLATEFVARHADHYGGLIAFTGGLIG